MFKRAKQPIEPERRRPEMRRGDRNHTYSYYANRRTSQATTQTSAAARSRNSPEDSKPRWYHNKLIRFWVITGIAIVVMIELTFLGSGGHVTVLDTAGNLGKDVDVVAYEETFQDLLGSSILNRNKLTVDTNGIARKMQSIHPELESVTVITPVIGIHASMYIHVSEPAFVLKQDSSSYILSAAGYITGRGTVNSLPIVVDETGEDVKVAKQLLPSSHVTFMRDVWYQLTEQGVAVDRFILPKGKAFEIDVRPKDRPYFLKFNVVENAVQQGGAAVAVIKQLGSAEPKEYIDLRVPGKAYYR